MQVPMWPLAITLGIVWVFSNYHLTVWNDNVDHYLLYRHSPKGYI